MRPDSGPHTPDVNGRGPFICRKIHILCGRCICRSLIRKHEYLPLRTRSLLQCSSTSHPLTASAGCGRWGEGMVRKPGLSVYFGATRTSYFSIKMEDARFLKGKMRQMGAVCVCMGRALGPMFCTLQRERPCNLQFLLTYKWGRMDRR